MPAVVYPHGGPTDYYGDDWDGHAQYFVDKGYAWLAINFRGSTGYGRDFERLNHGVWGVDDTKDCLAAADYLRTLDWVDGDRLGIFGASYGSYMALLAVTDDPEHRFRCAVPKYGDCDITTSWAQGDRSGVQDLERMMGTPAQAREAYIAGSAYHRLENVQVAAPDRARRARRARQPEAVRAARRAAARARQDVRVRDLPDRGARPAPRGSAARLLPAARALPRLASDVKPRERVRRHEATRRCARLRPFAGRPHGRGRPEPGRRRRRRGGKQIIFDVGDPQGIDSMSPLIGVTVAAYEAWNIQYATLTDKAANDFHTIPGLAESWEGSEDGKTWTYKLRDGLKWSDGKPLTAEDVAWTINTSRDEEWINHSATTVNLDAEATDDTTLVVKSKVPDPKLPTMDVYILPKHIWGKMNADERGKYDAPRRRRLRAVRARGVREGPVRALQGEPELLGRQAGRRQGRAAQVQQP